MDFIPKLFSLDELKDLCTSLGLLYQMLHHDTTRELGDDLLREMAQNNRQRELIASLRKFRPHIAWPDDYVYGTHGLKSSTEHFVDREQVLQSLQSLMQPGSIVGLTGIGGIGKSEVAAVYADRHGKEYSGGVYWIGVGDSLNNGLHMLGRQLPARPYEPPLESARQQISQAKEALFILDNVLSPTGLADFLALTPHWQAQQCCVLFTTRESDWNDYPRLRVDKLDEADAVQLLLQSSNKPAASEEAAAHAPSICRLLGFWPLAIRLAAPQLSRTSLVDYRRKLEADGLGNLMGDDVKILTKILAATWQDLPLHATRILCIASQVKQAAVPLTTLRLLSGEADQDTPSTLDNVTDALDALSAASLLEAVSQSQVSIHPLVREFAIEQSQHSIPLSDFRSLLENRIITNLKQQPTEPLPAFTAGECLPHLAWESERLTRAVVSALCRVMTGPQLAVSVRRRAAFVLLQLGSKRLIGRLAVDDTLFLMELVLPFLHSIDQREALQTIAARHLKKKLTVAQRLLFLLRQGQLLAERGRLLDPASAESHNFFAAATAHCREADDLSTNLPSPENNLLYNPQRLRTLTNLALSNILYAQAERASTVNKNALIQEALKTYQTAAAMAARYGQDSILTASIHSGWGLALALLAQNSKVNQKQWKQAKGHQQLALTTLKSIDLPVDDPERQTRLRALVHSQQATVAYFQGQQLAAAGDTAAACTEYGAAYQAEREQVDYVEETIGRVPQLAGLLAETHVNGCYNAADYLLERYQLESCRRPEELAEACRLWQTAVDLAVQYNLPGWRQWAAAQIERHCQQK